MQEPAAAKSPGSTQAASALSRHADPAGAASQLIEAVQGHVASADVAFLFVTPEHAAALEAVAQGVLAALQPRVLAGCTGQAVIGVGEEVEEGPAMSLLALRLPGGEVGAVALSQGLVAGAATSFEEWRGLTAALPRPCGGLIVLSDPFSIDAEALIQGLTLAMPGAVIAGGMASSWPGTRGTRLVLGDRVLPQGAVVVGLGGSGRLRPLVSQGATPIGQTWTLTAAEHNLVYTLGGRPALQVLQETVASLPPGLRERAARNLLAGVAMDEYRDEFRRGDFLVRNLLGADRESGAIAISGPVRAGQTFQFQFRDGEGAHEELTELLRAEAQGGGDHQPGAALLFACNGRGVGLFGTPHHDALALRAHFGSLPVAGLFCNGEIGPVGKGTFLHGFTASIAFLSCE